MPTVLELYNGALGWLKEPGLASTADARTARRELDNQYSKTLQFMLEQGMWNFASRKTQLTALSSDVVGFGFTYSFTRPSDYVRIIGISLSEHFTPTLNQFEEYSDGSGNYLRAFNTPIYLDYVSNSTAYGANPAKFPPTFTKAFELELAVRGGPKIASLKGEDFKTLLKLSKGTLIDAQAKDAVNQPAGELPQGRLTMSRGSGRGINRMRKVGYPGG